MAKGNLDVAFFAIEPKRAAEVAFSPPYAVIDGAYMVAKDLPLQTPADVDRPGIRVGVGLGSAYDLYLTRTLKNATIVRAKVGGGQASIDLFYAEKPDAAAGVRQPLEAHAKTNPNVRVMKQPFMAIAAGHGRAAGPAGRGALCARLHRRDEEEWFRRRRIEAQQPVAGPGGAAGDATSLRYGRICKTISVSTGASNARPATLTTARACDPRSGPSSATRKSDAPFTTQGPWL